MTVACRIGVLFLALAFLGSCNRMQKGPEAGLGAPGRTPQVVLYPASGGPQVTVQVELARTPEEHEQGLMFRKQLLPTQGMLFLFPRSEIRRFWMRNTYIPLDMLFFDEQRRLVGIEENAMPHDERGRGPDEPAKYVLEVQGGYARNHGIGPGSRAEFVDVP